MKRPAAALALVLLLGAGTGVPAAAAPGAPRPGSLDVYTTDLRGGGLEALLAAGVDRHELAAPALPAAGRRGAGARVEVVLSPEQVRRLRAAGVDVARKEVAGGTVGQRAAAQAADGYEVWQRYAGPGGLAEELAAAVAGRGAISELVPVGTSVNGTAIQAVRVTAGAGAVPRGSRPATVYLGAQHAREWITPEMVTRLLATVLDGYGQDPEVTALVDTTELWFLPVANPDGYDFSFEPDQRLWRKNLADNDGNGVLGEGDGVDLNRNFPTRFGYDEEGSSSDPASEVYRGPGPASEPETQAVDALLAEVAPEFVVNYHSAVPAILYGQGWQVATPTPDDVLYEALAGDDEEPAVPGYDPDLSAELYTTNGDTNDHATDARGALAFTVEMDTCQGASAADEDDEWVPEECGSVFEFPDDEALVQAEFERNVPFALAVGRSAPDPDDPVSVVGRDAPDLVVDEFEVSRGAEQDVAVVAKRSLADVRLQSRVDGGDVVSSPVAEWEGGERYGREGSTRYAELRGRVTGAPAGSEVEVWFTATGDGGPVESEHFTYEVEEAGGDVLVISNEDYTGVNPDYPDDVDAPKYAAAHVAAVEAAGYTADTWDVDARGVPHDLGVLSHYEAVLWYQGDDRLAMDPEDELTETPAGDLEDASVKESQQALTLAVRDSLNAGGKLVHAAETAQYSGQLGDSVGGLYYGLDGDPGAECVIGSDEGFFGDCLILADDFRQYWLGAYTRTPFAGPTGVRAAAGPGVSAALGGPAARDNPLDEAGLFTVTSSVLPVETHPQFASTGALEYLAGAGASPLDPVEGSWYAGVRHADAGYARLTRTVDLTGVDAAQGPQLAMQLSAATEAGYDHVVVEAHAVGADDWTTLPEAGGATTSEPPQACADLLELHPWLARYLGGEDCTEPGTTGTWNALSGTTSGWQEVAYDLSPYAGGQVEVSVTYVSDIAVGGLGALVDDTRVLLDGAVAEQEGFEGGLGPWAVTGPPEGSPAATASWERSQGLLEAYAGVATEDTLLLGFGLEQVATDAERAALAAAALEPLLGPPAR